MIRRLLLTSLQPVLASTYMCCPLLVPQRTGEAGPSEETWNLACWHWVLPLWLESDNRYAVLGWAATKLSKPSLSWQMSLLTLQTVNTQGELSEAVLWINQALSYHVAILSFIGIIILYHYYVIFIIIIITIILWELRTIGFSIPLP